MSREETADPVPQLFREFCENTGRWGQLLDPSVFVAFKAGYESCLGHHGLICKGSQDFPGCGRVMQPMDNVCWHCHERYMEALQQRLKTRSKLDRKGEG